MGTVSSVFSLKMVRLGLGLSEGPCPVGLASTINNWFPPKESHGNRRLYRGHHVCADYRAAVGGVDCGHRGWRWVFFSFAIRGSWRRLRYLLVKSKPSESGFVSQSELEEINAGRDIHKNTVRENILIADRFTLLDKIIRVKKMAPIDTTKDYSPPKISSVTAGLFYDG